MTIKHLKSSAKCFPNPPGQCAGPRAGQPWTDCQGQRCRPQKSCATTPARRRPANGPLPQCLLGDDGKAGKENSISFRILRTNLAPKITPLITPPPKKLYVWWWLRQSLGPEPPANTKFPPKFCCMCPISPQNANFVLNTGFLVKKVIYTLNFPLFFEWHHQWTLCWEGLLYLEGIFGGGGLHIWQIFQVRTHNRMERGVWERFGQQKGPFCSKLVWIGLPQGLESKYLPH